MSLQVSTSGQVQKEVNKSKRTDTVRVKKNGEHMNNCYKLGTHT